MCTSERWAGNEKRLGRATGRVRHRWDRVGFVKNNFQRISLSLQVEFSTENPMFTAEGLSNRLLIMISLVEVIFDTFIPKIKKTIPERLDT